MRHLTTALVALLAFFVLASGAHAIDLTTTPQTPLPAVAQRALAVAPEFWNRTAECPNGIATYATTDAPLAAGHCLLFFNPAALATDSPNGVCWKLLHEYGHLLGHGHSDDEHSIMYGGGRVIFESGSFRESFQGQGWCYGHGFYRRWRAYNAFVASHPRSVARGAQADNPIDPTPKLERPAFSIGYDAAHAALDTYAQATDGHVIVGPCARRGTLSIVCRARIVGPVSGRYRVIVTRDRENYVIRVRLAG